MEFLAVELDGAELAQVIGHELCVEQSEPAIGEPRGKVDDGDLRGVALVGEHAFPEECAIERNAVEAADELAVVPNFDRVAVTKFEQVAVEPADAFVDPRRAAAST